MSEVGLPILIFLAQLTVVTTNTIRLIFISRGRKFLSMLFGFCEVAIWLFAIGQVMQNLNRMDCLASYALGFTVGNYLGISLEERLAIGKLLVRIITHHDATQLVANLRKQGYGVTSLGARGAMGPVNVLFTVIERGDLNKIMHEIHIFDPSTFFSVEDVRTTASGVFPCEGPGRLFGLLRRPNPEKRLVTPAALGHSMSETDALALTI